jgi:hypothetical protein
MSTKDDFHANMVVRVSPKTKLPDKAILADLEDIEKARILKEYVETERKIAKNLGMRMTFVRPFLFEEEGLGALRCCNRRCKEHTVYISYTIGIRGRIAYCQKHGFEKMIEQMGEIDRKI